jgi:hypothetical protein
VFRSVSGRDGRDGGAVCFLLFLLPFLAKQEAGHTSWNKERELLVFFGSKAVSEPTGTAHFSGIFGTGSMYSWRLFIGAENSSDG